MKKVMILTLIVIATLVSRTTFAQCLPNHCCVCIPRYGCRGVLPNEMGSYQCSEPCQPVVLDCMGIDVVDESGEQTVISVPIDEIERETAMSIQRGRTTCPAPVSMSEEGVSYSTATTRLEQLIFQPYGFEWLQAADSMKGRPALGAERR